MKKIILTVAALSVVFGTASLATVWARSLVRATKASAAILHEDRETSSTPVQTFSGTISKEGDQFVLEGNAGKAPYLLDDQQTASRFSGEKVTVTGTFDATNNLIRVQSIQEANS
jgi:hypothetical protein